MDGDDRDELEVGEEEVGRRGEEEEEDDDEPEEGAQEGKPEGAVQRGETRHHFKLVIPLVTF